MFRLCNSCHRIFDGKDFCKRGHALVKDNLYIIKNRTNHRICKQCTLIRNGKYYNEKVDNNCFCDKSEPDKTITLGKHEGRYARCKNCRGRIWH